MKNLKFIFWLAVTAFIVWLLFFGPLAAIGADLSFRLYKSETSGSYTYGIENAVATATRWGRGFTYVNPTAGTYYFVATACDGQESYASNEVSGAVGDNETMVFSFDEYWWQDLYLKCRTPYSGTMSVGGGNGTMTFRK